MRDCILKMTTWSEGAKKSFVMHGKACEVDGGIFIRYSQEGDSSTLFLCEEYAKMERVGYLVMQMQFFRDGKGELLLKEGANEATVPVLVANYRLQMLGNDVKVDLDYDVCYPQEKQNFVISMNIKFLSEEK